VGPTCQRLKRKKEKAARTRAAVGKGKVGRWAAGPKGKVR
jgi:hypothetical protein